MKIKVTWYHSILLIFAFLFTGAAWACDSQNISNDISFESPLNTVMTDSTDINYITVESNHNRAGEAMAQIIKPTVNRVVLYQPVKTDTLDSGVPVTTNGDQLHSATISTVWADDLVNLSVVDANGNHYSKTAVVLKQDISALMPGQCCWMAYQKETEKQLQSG